VVPDRSAADHLPAAAARARRAVARLLIIALARPRTGFTIDPVILGHAAVRAQEEMRRLEQVAHQMLRDCGVDYEVVAMSYRNSRAPAKRERRIAAATNRLARARGAQLLPTQAMSDAGRSAAPGRTSSGRPAHVVAVLPDSAEAVRVAHTAGQHALAAHLPLALVVPVPGLGNTYDTERMTRGYTWIGEDMAAIAGRAQPALDLLGIPAHVFCAPYCTDMTEGSSRRNMAAAVEKRGPTVAVPSGRGLGGLSGDGPPAVSCRSSASGRASWPGHGRPGAARGPARPAGATAPDIAMHGDRPSPSARRAR
jgi:hypothetical protein